MPGIVGIVSRALSEDCQQAVQAMLACMQYKPEFAAGTCFAPELGYYAGWVAHPGSYAHRYSGPGGPGVDVALAGECVDDGEASAHSSMTAAPAGQGGQESRNPVLDAYDAQQDGFPRHLNGLFSGFLIDRRRGTALLFNDRYGCERIYVCEKNGSIYFASEAKALLEVLPEARAFDQAGVAQYLCFGSTLGETSLFHGVRVLPGGSSWLFSRSAPATRRRYFEPAEWERQPALGNVDFEQEFESTFRTALPNYFTDVANTIGISITGGLDTRMIMACLPEGARDAVCYTYAGMAGTTLDARLGRRVAELCGLPHHTLRIDEGFLSGFRSLVDDTVFRTDGCAGAIAAHEIYLARLARELSRVRLTGNFGSEVLRSMSTFKPQGLDAGLFCSDFRCRVAGAVEDVRFAHPVTQAAFAEVPWHLFGTMAAAKSELVFRTPYLDNAIVALAYRALPEARRSTAPALALIRRNKPALAVLPTDRGLRDEALLTSLARRAGASVTFKLDYLDTEGLPSQLRRLEGLRGLFVRLGLLGHHKYLPYRRWFRNELSGAIEDGIARARERQLSFWDVGFLKRMTSEHRSGQSNFTREIAAVLTLEAVDRLLITAPRRSRLHIPAA